MSYPDMLIAFENCSIDAAAHNEPPVTVAARRGLSTHWKGADEIVPNLQSREHPGPAGCAVRKQPGALRVLSPLSSHGCTQAPATRTSSSSAVSVRPYAR
jgi:hypothetical protein